MTDNATDAAVVAEVTDPDVLAPDNPETAAADVEEDDGADIVPEDADA